MIRSFLLGTTAVVALAPAALAQAPAPAPAPRPAPTTAPAGPAGAQPSGPTSVDQVTVVGQRSDVRSSIDRRSYSVANDLRAANGSVADALRNVPSVEVDVQGNLSLRGDPSVQILIDGKPSGMFQGEGRADALQALPADQIDRVEVMTNPSAAFRPDGSGGIINLITKKNRRPGKYVTVRGNVGTGGRANGGLTGTYTRDKLTLNGDLSLRRDRVEATADNARARLVGGQFLESRQSTQLENELRSLTYRVGIDYDPDAKNRLSASLRRFDLNINTETDQAFELEDAFGAVARAFQRRAESELERTQTSASASWRRTFTGQEHDLAVNFLFDRTNADRRTDATISTQLPTVATAYEDILSAIVQDLTQLKVDYNRPVGDTSRLKTGYEFELADNSYDSLGRRGADPELSPLDPNLTNLFLHELSVHSVYATYERPLGDKLTVLGGLRAEQVNVRTDQVTTAQVNEQDYFKIYPSLHLSYELSDEQKLTASYSLRTQRPNEDFLNPFVIYIDPLNLRAGNPLLRPQETHSFEAGWQYRKRQTVYLATLYFRDSTNGITQVTRDLGDNVFLTTFENLGERRAGGLELVANGPLSSKLSYNVSGNAFWEEIEASNLGFTEAQSGTSVSVRGALNWNLTPKDFLQVQGVINGRRLLPQGYAEPSGVLNLGYRRKVSDTLTLLVTAQDVLGTARNTVVLDSPTLRDRTENRPNVRALFVGFTYNFAKGPPRRQNEPGFQFDTSAGSATP